MNAFTGSTKTPRKLECSIMAPSGTWIVIASLSAFLAVSIYWFFRDREVLKFVFRLLGVATVCLILHAVFGFPFVAQAKGGTDWQDVYPIAGLYCAMILGMLAQYLHAHFSRPARTKREFDFGAFIAPIFLSPIVFIPLFETLKTGQQSARASVMTLLIAFENGFFFKNYMDQRGSQHEKRVRR